MNDVLESAIVTAYCTFLVWWIFSLSKRIVKNRPWLGAFLQKIFQKYRGNKK